jgi:hypothetical protein
VPLAVEFHPEARADLYGAIDWYDDERLGLGTAFSAAVPVIGDTGDEDSPRARPRAPVVTPYMSVSTGAPTPPAFFPVHIA